MWTWRQLGYHDKPVGLLNVAGYYDTLLSFMTQATADGFVPPAQHQLLQVGIDPAELLDRLRSQATRATAADDYRQI